MHAFGPGGDVALAHADGEGHGRLEHLRGAAREHGREDVRVGQRLQAVQGAAERGREDGSRHRQDEARGDAVLERAVGLAAAGAAAAPQVLGVERGRGLVDHARRGRL